MGFEFKTIRRVEFSETDMAGIVHFANFFYYMESAEHAFYRSLGFSVILDQLDPPLGFPRVHASCDYKRPLKFEDEFETHLLVKEKKSKVLHLLFKFHKLQGGRTVADIAQGELIVCCVAHQRDGSLTSTAIPSHLADLIEVAPGHLLA
ncbi:MAG: thioesterase family protein [Verrucomicrobiota bacterium]|nr:thioesterase family protein [Verrucomicrobiota bacterium]